MKTYGIRYDDKTYNCNDVLPASHVWDDGVMTEETLAGTCAIGVDYDPVYDDEEPDWMAIARQHDIYGYEHAYVLVSSEPCDYGEDAGEIIMPDAAVYRQLW